MNHSSKTTSSGISFSALLLVILGIIFLLNNFGLLPWNIWENLWKFWPVLLILFGLEVLVGRRSSPRIITILLLLIFILPLLLILNPLTGNPLATGSEKFSEPLGNLTKGLLNFELKAANIKIGALEQSSSLVFDGEIKYSELLPKPKLESTKRLGEGTYTFIQPSQNSLPFLENLGNNAGFNLSQLIPLEIKVKANSGVVNIDLEKIKVDLVEVDSSTGQTQIKFAQDYSTKVFIKTVAGVVKLNIPKEVKASIKTQAALQNVKVDEKLFPKKDDVYKSEGFDQSQYKIEVEISGQATNLEINSI